MLFFERDIAIDLGTMTTLIYVRGRGIRLRESSLVAMSSRPFEWCALCFSIVYA